MALLLLAESAWAGQQQKKGAVCLIKSLPVPQECVKLLPNEGPGKFCVGS